MKTLLEKTATKRARKIFVRLNLDLIIATDEYYHDQKLNPGFKISFEKTKAMLARELEKQLRNTR